MIYRQSIKSFLLCAFILVIFLFLLTSCNIKTNKSLIAFTKIERYDESKLIRTKLNEALFIMNEDGTQQKQLLDDVSFLNPCWSPDRSKILFSTAERFSTAESMVVPSYLFVVGLDGSKPIQLSENIKTASGDHMYSSPAWSPDGSAIAYTKANNDNHYSYDQGRGYNGSWDIYIRNLNDMSEKRLTSEWLAAYCPSWSPDGKRIAYFTYSGPNDGPGYCRYNVCIMNSDGSDRKRLTKFDDPSLQVSGSCGAIYWSPDSAKLYFSKEGKVEGVSYVVNILYSINSDGSDLKMLTYFQRNSKLSMSNDGKKFLYSYHIYDEHGTNIQLIDLDGNKTNVLKTYSDDANVSWLTEGKKIVYDDMVEGFHDIFIMEPDGSNKRRLTDGSKDNSMNLLSLNP